MSTVAELLLSNAIWSSLLALIALIITRFWKDPHLARVLWLLVLLKLVTPAFIEVPIALPTSAGKADIDAVQLGDPFAENLSIDQNDSSDRKHISSREPESASRMQPLGPLVFITIWAAGVLVLASFAVTRHRRLSRFIQMSSVADGQIQSETAHMANRLGVTKCPTVRVTEAPISPFVTAHLKKPVILFPRHLLKKMSREERQTVLAHELAHMRRGDRLIRLIEIIILGLHWWNPIAWLASSRLRRSMEDCCDAMVIWAMPDSRKSYGKALLRTVEFLTEAKAIQPIIGNTFTTTPIKDRIETIMKKEIHHHMTTPVKIIALLLGIAVLPIVTTGISQEETSGKQTTTEDKEDAEMDSDETPAQWEICWFVLVDGETDEVQEKVAKLIPKKTSATIEDIGDLLEKNGLPMYSTTKMSGGSEGDVPKEMKEEAKNLEFGETSRVRKIGKNYFMVRKTVNETALRAMREKQRLAEKAKREYKAQLRLLELDVKAAEIRRSAALAKAEEKDRRLAPAELRQAKFDAQLAGIEVERARLAIVLLKVKSE